MAGRHTKTILGEYKPLFKCMYVLSLFPSYVQYTNIISCIVKLIRYKVGHLVQYSVQWGVGGVGVRVCVCVCECVCVCVYGGQEGGIHMGVHGYTVCGGPSSCLSSAGGGA